MKRKRRFLFLVFFLTGLIIFSKSGVISDSLDTSLEVRQDYIDINDIISNNAIVLDRKTKEIVMGKNPEDKIYPASMTKVMTAIVAIEEGGNLRDRTEITSDIIDYCFTNGLSVSGFEAGDKPKLIDLLYGLMLESGGESCLALARAISWSEEEFISLMNEKARELGMSSTHFSNVTGISHEENYSSPKDIALLFDYALKNRTFKKIVTSKEYIAKGAKGPLSKHIINNALFQKRNAMDISKDYIQCGKTGYTEAAGLCLVSLGQVKGREYIVVTAKANGDSSTPQYNLLDTNHIYELLER